MVKVTVDVGNDCIGDLRVWNTKEAPPGLNSQRYAYEITWEERWDYTSRHELKGTVRHDRRNSVWVLIDRVLNASGVALPERKS